MSVIIIGGKDFKPFIPHVSSPSPTPPPPAGTYQIIFFGSSNLIMGVPEQGTDFQLRFFEIVDETPTTNLTADPGTVWAVDASDQQFILNMSIPTPEDPEAHMNFQILDGGSTPLPVDAWPLNFWPNDENSGLPIDITVTYDGNTYNYAQEVLCYTIRLGYASAALALANARIDTGYNIVWASQGRAWYNSYINAGQFFAVRLTNPFTQDLKFDLITDGAAGEITAYIYDAGQSLLVSENSVGGSSSNQIIYPNAPAGNYYLVIRNNTGNNELSYNVSFALF